MFELKHITMLLGMMLFLTACDKQDCDLVYESCEDFPPFEGIGEYDMESRQINYSVPFYNSTNQQEFAYHRWDGDIAEAWTHNTEQNTSKKLLDSVLFQPKWKGGHILSVRHDLQIWKIRSDGDSLTQLTNFGINTYPSWHPKEDKIVYKSTKKLSNGTLFIMDSDGNDLEDLDIIGTQPAWSPNGQRIAFVGYTNDGNVLSVYNSDDQSVTTYEQPFSSFIEWVIWLKDDQLLWDGEGGVYVTKLSDKSTRLLIQDCSEKIYSGLSLSPDRKFLLCRKTIQSLDIEESTIYSESDIVRINLESLSEEVLVLE